MERRDSIKALLLGTISTGALLKSCETEEKKSTPASAEMEGPKESKADRMAEEIAYDKNLVEEIFFTAHEMATIKVLGDIIIPRDEISGSASDAHVADFIEFIVKDKPWCQTPMRGGLRWLDMKCLSRYERSFKDCASKDQFEMVDNIAYPQKAKLEFRQGVIFFSLMRNLTISGFYTTRIGVEDVGYMGNKANQWNGVPDDVLKQYNMSYSEKELKQCINFDQL
ncbi:MAG: gluconate 2-dehydrogenase subunit 3 family protein [Ferruginibacter sp.]